MIGSDNLYTCCVCTIDDFFYDLVSGKNFNVDQIYISGLCCFDVEFCVCFRLDRFLAAFFGSTECHKKRDVSKSLTKILEYIFNFGKIKNAFKPVYTPFNNINRNRIKGFCFFDDVFFCNTNDRNDDLRCACTDLDITDFHCIHDFCPFLYMM